GLRLARREADEVARLQSLARSASKVRGRGRKDAVAWLLEAGDAARDALRLARLTGGGGNVRRITRLERLARAPLRATLRRVPVTGGDVIRWASGPPGPRVGELLAELRLQIALGAVRNRREARNWLAVQVRPRP